MYRNSSSSPRSVAPAAVLAVAGLFGVGAMLAQGGCMTRAAIAPRSTSEASLSVREEAVASTRPSVKVSAADLYSWGPGAAVQQLEFYDEVESREIVAHDDVLHAALLFGRGASASTFAQRVALARQEGLIDKNYNRPGREAATVGEAAQVIARVLRLEDVSSPQAATAALSRIGVLPAHMRADQGITGRQFLALLGSSYDWLRHDQTNHRPLVASRPPVVDLEEQAAAMEQAAASAAPVAAAAPASAPPSTQTPRAMAEPLPELPPSVAHPTPAPVAAAPRPEPAVAAAVEGPRPQPTPRPWVAGRPLKKNQK